MNVPSTPGCNFRRTGCVGFFLAQSLLQCLACWDTQEMHVNWMNLLVNCSVIDCLPPLSASLSLLVISLPNCSCWEFLKCHHSLRFYTCCASHHIICFRIIFSTPLASTSWMISNLISLLNHSCLDFHLPSSSRKPNPLPPHICPYVPLSYGSLSFSLVSVVCLGGPRF